MCFVLIRRRAAVCGLPLAPDPAAERFTGPNAPAANRLRHRAYRGAWTV